ncbi:hypothetical protein FPSE_07776 [Fusarium pseudograminearum CS3096]|uniref:Uncharacterized protein n=1 Tax=Fusarium pseudograminearum (strain CS3096) TaxID=1028729 RepID=K3VDZ5_FUSPC|nr:hypothetical protein FPSE_07776 [Fusarium pseudograminearum CS3096]EKJ72034.1 hypothetical protein FPSE_07776 [Fusarium pseudograminearum CS3096]
MGQDYLSLFWLNVSLSEICGLCYRKNQLARIMPTYSWRLHKQLKFVYSQEQNTSNRLSRTILTNQNLHALGLNVPSKIYWAVYGVWLGSRDTKKIDLSFPQTDWNFSSTNNSWLVNALIAE